VKHISELGQPSRQTSGWARFAKGNGRENGENKIELKGFPRKEEKFCI
jgi:hypothetical protein